MVEKCCYTCTRYMKGCELYSTCTRHDSNERLSEEEKSVSPIEAGLHNKADYWDESRSKRALMYRIQEIEKRLGM